MRAATVLALAMATAAPLPVWAAGPNDACVNQVNGAYDAVASQNWQDALPQFRRRTRSR